MKEFHIDFEVCSAADPYLYNNGLDEIELRATINYGDKRFYLKQTVRDADLQARFDIVWKHLGALLKNEIQKTNEQHNNEAITGKWLQLNGI